MPRTPEDTCRRLVGLLTERTGITWTFGYLGNDHGNDTSGRRYYAFAAHPGRVGGAGDSIGGFADPADLVPWLQGALALALVQSTAR